VRRAARQSENGLAAVLQPKLSRLPSLAACRRLSKRHTWFGMDDDGGKAKKPAELLSEEAGKPLGSAASRWGGCVHLNAVSLSGVPGDLRRLRGPACLACPAVHLLL